MQPKEWEYRTVKLDDTGWYQGVIDFEVLDTKLNQIGREGWELVNVVHLKEGNWFGQSASVVAFLKRPLNQKPRKAKRLLQKGQQGGGLQMEIATGVFQFEKVVGIDSRGVLFDGATEDGRTPTEERSLKLEDLK